MYLKHLLRVVIAGLMFLVTAQSASAGLLYMLPYRWTDSDGRTVALNQFLGTPTVITMSYGASRKVCSTAILRMEQMQVMADRAKTSMEFVIVGFDATKDTPEDWHELRQSRKLTRSNWHFLTGGARDVQGLAGNLGLKYTIGTDHVMFDFGITLLDSKGNPLRKMKFADDSLEQFLRPALPEGTFPETQRTAFSSSP